MKKNIKLIGILITLFLTTLLFNTKVSAAGATISIKSNNSAIVGNTITATVTLSSSQSLGSWDFTIGYDTSLLRLVSSTAESGQRSVGYVSGNGQTSKSYTFTFKALKSGTASIYVNSAEVYGFDESLMSVTKGTKKITIRTEAEIQASYSKNNYLSSLSIEGYELTPNFDKETLEYSIDLDSDVEKIRVNATKEDSTASIIGGGEIDVSEGANVIQIVVTAQNGNTRTYTITANVIEINPINVTLNGKNYTVIKRKNVLVPPNNFIETTVVINNEEVPAFYNEITNYTIVGLKDNKNNIGLYLYDLDSGKFTLYKELVFNTNKLFILDPIDDLEGFEKTTIEINGSEVSAYKLSDDSTYFIIYGVNLNTGNTDYYMYDSIEYTIQRYNSTMLDRLTSEKDKYLALVIVLSSVCFLSMLFLLIEVNRDNKRKSEN